MDSVKSGSMKVNSIRREMSATTDCPANSKNSAPYNNSRITS